MKVPRSPGTFISPLAPEMSPYWLSRDGPGGSHVDCSSLSGEACTGSAGQGGGRAGAPQETAEAEAWVDGLAGGIIQKII